MPAAPDPRGSEHTATATHVSEGSLAGTVSSAAGDTGDTGYGTASAPGLGGGLVAGFAGDGVGLAGVFGYVGVDEVDDVWTDGGFHDGGEGEGGGGVGGHVGFEWLDGDERAGGGHFWVQRECGRGVRVSAKRVRVLSGSDIGGEMGVCVKWALVFILSIGPL
ncbi:hypothetical protein HanXRQr2_Chr09g0391931 [Helianthus annuus]|uniref:Uncharacterized protein n=1 Tax=Helianthus annuus TaxID=4232 RepID=A0A9K3N9C7_HELAN|nr:hypothetical protein HanXRQr2_Chr09g0391931 [Helianthus annuus]KAJ0893463.1 hypothetical protein HanPSC8_Chr09g0377891 [Helianthus annuus]